MTCKELYWECSIVLFIFQQCHIVGELLWFHIEKVCLRHRTGSDFATKRMTLRVCCFFKTECCKVHVLSWICYNVAHRNKFVVLIRGHEKLRQSLCKGQCHEFMVCYSFWGNVCPCRCGIQGLHFIPLNFGVIFPTSSLRFSSTLRNFGWLMCRFYSVLLHTYMTSKTQITKSDSIN